MLDDMPKSQSVALSADSDDAVAAMTHAPARLRGMRLGPRRGREKVVRPSALGMLLRPIGVAVGVVLIAYALLSLGTTFYRGYYRHLDHTAPVHADNSVLDIFLGDRSLPQDAVDLVIKDVDGSLHKVVASKSDADKFVNDTILMLDEERARIKQAAHEDLDRSFALAFQDRDQAIAASRSWKAMAKVRSRSSCAAFLMRARSSSSIRIVSLTNLLVSDLLATTLCSLPSTSLTIRSTASGGKL